MERKERAKTAATGGMTLVEVVVSLALLAVVALILVTGFSAAGKLIRRGTDTKNSTDKTISALEMLAGGLSPADEVDSTEEESTLTYTLNGATRSVKGRTITVTDPEDPAISHRVFVPDAPAQ
ncbi:prepilin-type N-terminal cleavage/methylation domain-containing protein [Acetanaerobacterium sp. MSJ-12]|uniref:type II secretion system protein n=1 Tax=Oscillospiraceae TaxID=216572 RepID=UPI00163C3B7A|nr:MULTISPECIES: prepilin-type N-terminal cleavage/methylation domain-containing protein [Oscillospiraceae]MBC2871462.1 prepilin-type N-terminal cleavage/methylation domain-containing protein [Bittarella massiliensis (ex Durand et al. 2017)]MBU5419037.1 prepilin-type N-terminal cleavage/methylation domain-containing protein [Acetanaerobacterium sp. MSJ-12]